MKRRALHHRYGRSSARLKAGQHVRYPGSYPGALIKGLVWEVGPYAVRIKALDRVGGEYTLPIADARTLRPWTTADEAAWHAERRR